MSEVNLEMVQIFKEELKLCNASSDENVAVLTQGTERKEYAKAMIEAASELDIKVFEVNLPMVKGVEGSWGTNPLTENQFVLDVLKKCDLVIDLIALLWSKEQIELQKSGTRILLVYEPFDSIKSMLPKKDDKTRILKAGEYLKESNTLHFTNEAGTNITYNIEDSPILHQYGFAEEPGRWDHFTSSLIATIANNNEVNGVVVLKEGDILYPFNRYVKEKVYFTINNGYITEIKGGFEADLIKEYMEQFNDPRAYAISHIGWGVNKRAKWSDLVFNSDVMGMQGRCFYGNVLFSTGPNVELGGSNDTNCHIDIPMKDCTLYLDNQKIVDNGEVTIKEIIIE